MVDLFQERERAYWEGVRQRREAVAERRRRAEAAHGRRVDVAPCREHLESLLAAGMTIEDIAVRAELDRATVRRMLRPATKGVFRESALAVLSVAPVSDRADCSRDETRWSGRGGNERREPSLVVTLEQRLGLQAIAVAADCRDRGDPVA